MFAAAGNGNPEIVPLLLKAGANARAKNTNGKTALGYARENDKIYKTKAFWELNDAFYNQTKGGMGRGTIKDEARDSEGRTPLMLAVQKNSNLKTISMLINSGAQVEARDAEGFSSLMFAAKFNSDLEVIALLLKAGADFEAKNWMGNTSLMLAAQSNSNPEVTSVLLKAGAQLEARDVNGLTPLMFAAAGNGNPEIVPLLLKAGANARAKNTNGKTALGYAKENKKIFKTMAFWDLNDAFYNQK